MDMSLTLPELACVIAIGVAAVQLPNREVTPDRADVRKAPAVAAPAHGNGFAPKLSAAHSGAATDATKDTRLQ